MIRKLKNHIFVYIQQFFDELEKKMLFHIRAESLQKLTLNSVEQGVCYDPVIEGKQVIVSLTTYEKRFYDVYLTIESILQQTMKPNRIILWLGEEMKDFQIPLTLHKQQERGLEIRYTKDIRSYKKLIPTLKEFPDDVIITVDDDVLYNHDFIENLVNAYLKEPHCVHCGWAKHLALGDNGKLMPWRDCPKRPEEEIKTSLFNLPVGCAGILYPPNSLDKEVFNEEVFMDICKYADDIWFKAMSLKASYPCKAICKNLHNYMYVDNPSCKHQGLTLINISKDMNNKQIQAVFDKYNLHAKLNGNEN